MSKPRLLLVWLPLLFLRMIAAAIKDVAQNRLVATTLANIATQRALVAVVEVPGALMNLSRRRAQRQHQLPELLLRRQLLPLD